MNNKDTIFWNVDTQYDFMMPGGNLYIKNADKIQPKLASLTEFAKNNNIKVVNTGDWHYDDSKELSKTPDFITTFPEHCMVDTIGAEFVFATNPIDSYKIYWKQNKFDEKKVLENRNITIYKDKFDVFKGNPHTDEIVKILSPKSVVAYGVASNVCADYAVMGLLERKIQVYVPLDSVKGLPNLPEPYEKWEKNGAILTTTDEIYKKILEDSK